MKKYHVEVSGMAYRSPGDGGEMETYSYVTEQELTDIRAIAKKKNCDINDLDADDLPREIFERFEDAIIDADYELYLSEECSYNDDEEEPLDRIDFHATIGSFFIKLDKN